MRVISAIEVQSVAGGALQLFGSSFTGAQIGIYLGSAIGSLIDGAFNAFTSFGKVPLVS